MDRLPQQAEAQAIFKGAGGSAHVVTLLFTDVVGSTALKQRLGDHAGVELVQQHHRLVRGIIAQFDGAEEVAVAGDSFLILFPVPSEAVKCALKIQERLARFNRISRAPVADRMGLHMGEVVMQRAGGRLDVLGIQVDTCSRVMSLAQAGQILMTRSVFDNARQSLKGEDLEGVGSLSWLNHGRFELKGVEEPVEICEVRGGAAEGLGPPTTSEKARRVEAAEGEAVLGWRPAVGQIVPKTRWVLEEKLGEGGFGEVWKARHDMLKETRVFKFCFRADRVRTLKREVTLVRLLKERVGEHPNIVKLHDIYFDEPPYYLEEEYVAGRDLRNWCEAQGGIGQVALEVKLELVAQAAEALQAAHDSGVIHRDVKPGNILILDRQDAEGSASGLPSLTAKLTDFGIGQVISEEVLKGVTRDGFTQTMLNVLGATHTGTQLYMAPELWEGKPASTRSDIYSLGVVLYQLLVGDFKRPVTADWIEDVSDPLLRDDLRSCFARKPEDRFAAVGLLARNLRALPARRTEAERQAWEKAQVERAAYRRGIVRTAGIASLIVAVILVLSWQVWSNAAAKLRQAAQMRSSTVRLTVANGLNPLDSGDWLTAALWFSEAFVLDEAFQVSPDAKLTRQTHRLRMNSLLSQSPRLEQMWFDDAGMCGGFDRAGQHILLGGLKGHTVYDVHTGRGISPTFGQGCLRASLHPDGRRAATGGGGTNSVLSLWDVTTGARLSYLSTPGSTEPFRGDCADLQFSADGRWIAAPVSGERGLVLIWEPESGCVQQALAYTDHPDLPWTPNDFITAARFDFSGERLLTADTKNRAVIWQWKTGTVLRVLQGHGSWVYGGCFAREHTNWVLTCSFDRTARLWALDTGQTLLRVAHEGDSIQEVQFSPDDKMFVTGGLDAMVRFWDSQTGRLMPPVLRNQDRVTQVLWSADGARVAVTTRDGVARVWCEDNGRTVIRPVTADFSADGRLMLEQHQTMASVQDLAGKRAPSVSDLGSTNVSGLLFAGGPERFLSFARLPGSNATNGSCLRLHSARETVGSPLVYDPSWSQFVCAPSGRRFALWADGDADETPPGTLGVLVWEPERSPQPRFIACGGEPVDAVAFDEQGRRMVIGSHLPRSDSGVLRWVDLDAAGEPPVFMRSKQRFVHLAFSPDGKWLAAAESDKSLDPGAAVVWPLGEHGPLVQEPSRLPHRDGVLCTAFSDTSQMLATASEDQTAFVWRRSRNVWQPSPRPLRCGGEVHACVFSHNGRWVATAHRTPESQQARRWRSDVRIWDTANSEPVSVRFAFREKITRLLFVDGDRRLLVERWVPPAPPRRWLVNLAVDEGSAKEFLLLAELLSSQRSFLSGASTRMPGALGGTLSAEEALLHATTFGPLRLLSKEDCRELWLHLSSTAN